MADIIIQILTWAIPSGGVGVAIGWLFNRNVHNAETAKVVHDIYKRMYEDVSRLLIERTEQYERKVDELSEKYERKVDELTQENTRTRTALNRLSRALEAIQLCHHRFECPVRDELQKSGDDIAISSRSYGITDTNSRAGGRRQRNTGGKAPPGSRRKGVDGCRESGSDGEDEPSRKSGHDGEPEGEGNQGGRHDISEGA